MHSFKANKQGGVFRSGLTQKEYFFIADSGGRNRREALRLMQTEDKAQAPMPRKRVPAPSREQVIMTTDHQTKTENVRHLASSPRWQEETPNDRLAKLQQAKASARTPGELAKIERRIVAHQNSQIKGEFKRDQRQARQEAQSSPDFASAKQDADAALSAVEARQDLDDSFYRDAKNARLNLIQSGNIPAFREAQSKLQARYDALAQSKIETAEATMATMRQSLKGMKSETLLPPATDGTPLPEVSPDATE